MAVATSCPAHAFPNTASNELTTQKGGLEAPVCQHMVTDKEPDNIFTMTAAICFPDQEGRITLT